MNKFAAVASLLFLLPGRPLAQELEPGAYWPIPTGLNIVTVVNSFNWGDMAFDPAAPIDEATATINTTAFSFTRAFGLAGRSANAGIAVPVVGGHVEGLYLGEAADVDRFGLGDPRLRLAVNLYGAPAMVPKSFASYQQRTLVGVSVTVAPPLGEYDSAKLINLGTNRWSFKPELGVSKAWGPLTFELATGVRFYTDNNDFLDGKTLQVKPIYSVQGHLIYSVAPGIWLGLDALYYTGGRAIIDGRKGQSLENARIGLTVALPINRYNSVKLYGSTDVYSKTRSKFDVLGIVWQVRWGGGL